MRLLLDTHVLIWLAEGVETLPPASRKRIDEAAQKGGIAVSGISFWEVAMLDRHGRIALSTPLDEWRRVVLRTPGFAEIPVSGDVGIEAVGLPGSFHADPADRILVATARLFGLTLGTRDRRLLAYGKTGHASAVRL